MAKFKTPSGRQVNWWEIADDPCSPRLRFEPDRTTAVRTIECAWADYLDLAHGIIGDSFVATGPAITQEHLADELALVSAGAQQSAFRGYAPAPPLPPNPPSGGYAPTPAPRPFPWVTSGYAYVGRYIPWSFPIRNSTQRDRFMFASSCEIEGRGVPDDNNQFENDGAEGKDAVTRYKNARLTVQFETRLYDIMSDEDFIARTANTVDESLLIRYVTKIYRPQGEFLHLDGNAYYYAGISPAKALTRGVNKTIISYNLSLTWHFVPQEAVPSAFINYNAANLAIDKCLGRVNDDLFHGCRQGTLLLMAAELKPQVSAFGNRNYDITYMFKFLNPSQTEINGNVPGHNHIYRPFGANESPPSNGWREAVASTSLATSATPTNFVARTDDINIYNFANFRNLFRPASWS